MIEYREQVGGVSGDGKSLHGLVTPFDTWTTIGDIKRGGFKERIGEGAFTKTLAERDVVLINGHDPNQPMARTSIADGPGSLSLTPTPGDGLRCQGLPTDTSYARDVLVNAAAGVVRGMSFGFEVVKDSWTDDRGNPSDNMRGTNRTILEVRLHEVTTTAFPAYPTTELAARSRGETEDLLRRREAFRDGGDERAAAASYKDLYTCGDCGQEGQYGSYCGACGEPMSEPSQSGNLYCTVCGGPVDEAGRNGHVHSEKRDDPDGVEYAAMELAIRQIQAGKTDEAVATLQAVLPADEDDTEAGSATSDDEAERAADMLALHRSLTLGV